MAASERLSALVADHCLSREPFQSTVADIGSSDNTAWTLEIEVRGQKTRIAGRDTGFGRAGGIIHLLSGGSPA